MKKPTDKKQPDTVRLVAYVNATRANYVRQSIKANGRTISSQVDAMLSHAQKAGV